MSLASKVIACLQAGARCLRQHQYGLLTTKIKENTSSVVTEADLDSERAMIRLISEAYPDHNILAEESGFRNLGSPYTWVLDPLDGTSNYAAQLPWFGVIVSVLKGTEPVCAGMYLPVPEVLYFCERGGGVERNGVPVRLPKRLRLRETLWAYGIDAAADSSHVQRQLELLGRLIPHVRNVRATNSLADFCYTLEGKLGGFINLNAKIWDISAIQLMMPEAGGGLTDLSGHPIRFALEPATWGQSYQVIGSESSLLSQVLTLCQNKA
jgi:myo-inositol-1(or 4)-monophosphatase